MRIFISEFDRHNAYRAAILPLARYYKIENFEFKSILELYLELSIMESSIFDDLNEYLLAYDSWFGFYAERKNIDEAIDIDYNLSDSEGIQLAKLIKSREEKLEKLLNNFN